SLPTDGPSKRPDSPKAESGREPCYQVVAICQPWLPDVPVMGRAVAGPARVARTVVVASVGRSTPVGPAVAGVVGPTVASVVGPAPGTVSSGPAALVHASGTAHRCRACMVDPVRTDVRVPDVGRTISADIGRRQHTGHGGRDHR